MNEPSSIPADRARAIRIVLFDVDGVLTDAGIYMGQDAVGRSVELKRFNIQDGLGIKLLKMAGLKVAFVSGRVSPATVERARELEVDHCYQEPNARKLPWVRELLDEEEIAWDEVAMLADDLPDLAVFREVGFKAAVGNAVEEIRGMADWIAKRNGGEGAAREFCEAILKARGEWDALVEEYARARS